MGTIEARIALDLLPANGPRLARRLLEVYRTPDVIFVAPIRQLDVAPHGNDLFKEFKPPALETDDNLTIVAASHLSIDEIAAHLFVDIREATRRASMLELQEAIDHTEDNGYISRSMNG